MRIIIGHMHTDLFLGCKGIIKDVPRPKHFDQDSSVTQWVANGSKPRSSAAQNRC